MQASKQASSPDSGAGRARRALVAAVIAAASMTAQQAQAQEVLGGDAGLACQALLCLSSPTRPGECASALAKYFGIRFTRPDRTITARLNFLQLCPTSDANTQSLMVALANGAGACDAATLNDALRTQVYEGGTVISGQMPAYCNALFSHPYLQLNQPAYVGVPERGGFWVEQSGYSAALAAYEARIRAEDAQAEADKNLGGF